MIINPGIIAGSNAFIANALTIIYTYISDELTAAQPFRPVNLTYDSSGNVDKVRGTAVGPAVWGETVFDTTYTCEIVAGEVKINDKFFTFIEEALEGQVDIAFDKNGYPAIAYQTSYGVYVYWRDDVAYVHTLVAGQASHPFIDLNNHTFVDLAESELIFAYASAEGCISCNSSDKFAYKVGLLKTNGVIAVKEFEITSPVAKAQITAAGDIQPAAFYSSSISSLTFNDSDDTAGFTASEAGNIYWAITPAGVTPTQEEIRQGTGAVLQSGVSATVQTGGFVDHYTSASGAHLQIRQLNFFLDPFGGFATESPIVTTPIELFLTPLKFKPHEWSLENEGNGSSILLDIEVLPFDNGDPLTSIEYNLNGAGWVTLPHVLRGTHEITSLTQTVQSFQVRSSNTSGPSYISDTKAIIPEVTEHTSFLFGSWQADALVTGANESVILDGADVWDWRDPISFINFGAKYTKAVYRATGTPNGGPCLEFGSGSGMEASMDETEFLEGVPYPLANQDRTLVVVIKLPVGNPTFPACPIYGVDINSRAFGLSFNADYEPVFDYWGAQVAGTTSFGDNNFRVVMVSHRKSTSRVFVDDVLDAEQIDIVLSTEPGVMRIGRSLSGNSKSGFSIAAIMMYDHGLSATHRAQVQTFLSNKYMV